MNDDKLQTLIARTLYGQNEIYDVQTGAAIPWDELLGYQECWQRDAEGLLTGLRAAGYTIVELPEPDEGRDDWLDGGVHLTHDGYVMHEEDDDGGHTCYTAGEARTLAAALLAAVAVAEREQ